MLMLTQLNSLQVLARDQHDQQLMAILSHQQSQEQERIQAIKSQANTVARIEAVTRQATSNSSAQEQLPAPEPSNPPTKEATVLPLPGGQIELTHLPCSAYEPSQISHADDVPCVSRRGGCFCRCHTKLESTGRWIFFAVAGIPTYFQTCDKPDCNSRVYGVSLRVALAQIGIPCAWTMSLDLSAGCTGLRLYPSLTPERVVPYTYPGFRILEEIQHRSLIDWNAPLDIDTKYDLWSNARDQKVLELQTMFKSGRISPRDVDPQGRSWLEVRTIARNSHAKGANGVAGIAGYSLAA